MCVYLCAKFEFSSIILTSFRRGNLLPPPPPFNLKLAPKNPTQIRVKVTFEKPNKRMLLSSRLLTIR